MSFYKRHYPTEIMFRPKKKRKTGEAGAGEVAGGLQAGEVKILFSLSFNTLVCVRVQGESVIKSSSFQVEIIFKPHACLAPDVASRLGEAGTRFIKTKVIWPSFCCFTSLQLAMNEAGKKYLKSKLILSCLYFVAGGGKHRPPEPIPGPATGLRPWPCAWQYWWRWGQLLVLSYVIQYLQSCPHDISGCLLSAACLCVEWLYELFYARMWHQTRRLLDWRSTFTRFLLVLIAFMVVTEIAHSWSSVNKTIN